MNFLLLNASAHRDGATFRALSEAKRVFDEKGDTSTVYWLGKAPRYSCLACGGCRAGGRCVIGDLEELYSLLRDCDGIILGTPTYYATASGNLLSVLSRLCFSAKELLKNKPAATIATARRAGAICAVNEVNKFFDFCSMITVGGCYPPILYGGETDAEGLQNARSLANMMHWVADCIKIGKENGIFPPEEEPKIKTNI